ncbi:MAG: hypothetical protein RSC20_02455 [Clostridiales bacterium]
MSNKNNIKIKTFGDFSIIFNGENIIPDSSNKNKVLYFLQYIIQNRYRSVSQQELIDIILANDECSDPINTLKNLAYRSRQYFKNAGLPEKRICLLPQRLLWLYSGQYLLCGYGRI